MPWWWWLLLLPFSGQAKYIGSQYWCRQLINSSFPPGADNDDRLAAHQLTQSRPPSQADYRPDMAETAQVDFISSLAANADQVRCWSTNVTSTRFLQRPDRSSPRVVCRLPGHIVAPATSSSITQTRQGPIRQLSLRFRPQQRELSSNTCYFLPNKNWFFAFVLFALAVAIYFRRLQDRHIHWSCDTLDKMRFPLAISSFQTLSDFLKTKVKRKD